MSDTHVSEAVQQEREEQREAAVNEMDAATHQMINDVRAKVSMPTPPFVFGRNAATNEELLQKAADMPVQHRAPKDKAYNVKCPHKNCPAVIRSHSLVKHLRVQHGDTAKRPFGWMRELRTDAPLTPRGRRPGSPQKKPKPVTAVVPKAPKPTPIEPEELSEMVLNVLFPKGIPVAKLRAVTRWQEATDTFIKEAEL